MAEPKIGPNKGNAGKGRPKGSPNKTTALLKDAILTAAQEAGGKDGLVGYLRIQAHENPAPFMSLLGKVLPMQIQGDVNVSVSTKEQRDAAVSAFTRANS